MLLVIRIIICLFMYIRAYFFPNCAKNHAITYNNDKNNVDNNNDNDNNNLTVTRVFKIRELGMG